MALLNVSKAVRSVKSFAEFLVDSLRPTLTIVPGGEPQASAQFSVNPDPRSPRGASKVNLTAGEIAELRRALGDFNPNRERDLYTVVSASLRMEDITEDKDGEEIITGKMVTFDVSDKSHARKVCVPASEWGNFLGFLETVQGDLTENGEKLAAELLKVQADEDKRAAEAAARKAAREAKAALKVKV